MQRILLVEDHPTIAENLIMILSKHYLVETAADFVSAAAHNLANIDLVLLDISLPGGSGLDLYKLFHRLHPDLPIIFLTANDTENTIVRAFELGCNDYLTKPFRTGELLARIKKLLPRELIFGDITVDLDARAVVRAGVNIDLTSKEFDLLVFLIEHSSAVITRANLIAFWEEHDRFVNDNTVTVYIKRLRSKLGDDFIKTIKNTGYVLAKN